MVPSLLPQLFFPIIFSCQIQNQSSLPHMNDKVPLGYLVTDCLGSLVFALILCFQIELGSLLLAIFHPFISS